MPRIPRVTSQISPRGSLNVNVSAASVGGILGASLQNLGRNITEQDINRRNEQIRTAAAEKQAVDKIKKREGETLAIRKAAQFQRDEMELFNQAMITNQETPDGFTDRYLNDIDGSLDDLKSVSDNPFYQNRIEDLFLRMQPNLINKAISFESSQKTSVQTQRIIESNNDRQFILQNRPESFPEQRQAIIDDINIAMENGIIKNGGLIKERNINEAAFSALNGFISRNDFDGADKFLKDNGSDFGGDFNRAKSIFVKGKNSFERKVESSVTMGELITGQTLGDPKNSKHVDAFDTWYETVSRDFNSGDPDTIQVVALGVRHSNVIGKELKSDLRGMILSSPNSDENLDRIIGGASFMAGIADTNPQAYDASFTEQEKRIVRFYDTRVGAGRDQDEIKKEMFEFFNKDPLTIKVEKDRSDRFSAIIRKKKNIIPDLVGDLFGDDIPPDTRDRLSAQAEIIMKEEFINNGDLDIAKKFTEDNLNLNFRRSGAGFRGGVLRFSPESVAPEWFNQHYRDFDWSRIHLDDKLKAIGVKKTDFDETYIMPNNNTAAQFQSYRKKIGSGQLADSSDIKYQIWVQKDGVHDILENQDGLPITISFDLPKIRDKLEIIIKNKRDNNSPLPAVSAEFGKRFFGAFE